MAAQYLCNASMTLNGCPEEIEWVAQLTKDHPVMYMDPWDPCENKTNNNNITVLFFRRPVGDQEKC